VIDHEQPAAFDEELVLRGAELDMIEVERFEEEADGEAMFDFLIDAAVNFDFPTFADRRRVSNGGKEEDFLVGGDVRKLGVEAGMPKERQQAHEKSNLAEDVEPGIHGFIGG
jgi:hypothetical protein